MNRTKLNQLFKAMQGCIRREKLRHTEHCLRYSDMSITEVAHATDFCSSSHFSHFFRKRTGRRQAVPVLAAGRIEGKTRKTLTAICSNYYKRLKTHQYPYDRGRVVDVKSQKPEVCERKGQAPLARNKTTATTGRLPPDACFSTAPRIPSWANIVKTIWSI